MKKKILILLILIFILNISTVLADDFGVIVKQKDSQADPTIVDNAEFTVIFSEPINTATFVTSDIIITGTTGTITSGPIEVAPNNGTTFEFTVTGMSDGDTVIATMNAGVVQNAGGDNNFISAIGGNETKFLDSPEFQAIPTSGAYDWEKFTIGADTYLAVANSGNGTTFNVDSKIYKWNGVNFAEFQAIPTNGAHDWEAFTIGADTYLAVANYHNDVSRNIDSKIYKWNGVSFVEVQAIPTNSATDWEAFTIGADTYLAVANSYNGASFNIDSKIYKWNGVSFVEIQAITTNLAMDWEAFTIGADTYLVVANSFDGASFSVDSKIYKWNGVSFVEIQAIATNGAYDWEAFTIGADTYLAVANARDGGNYNIDSKIYKWNGVSFVEIQTIATNSIEDWESFVIGNDTYLAAANYYNGSSRNIDSKIYKWDGNSFLLDQDISTNGALDWKYFKINSDSYLAIANTYNDTSTNIDSKIFKQEIDNRVTCNFVPVILENIPVTNPTTDNTPNYTFSSTEAGTITYAGGCDSATTNAVSGNNTITFNTLINGTYDSCTITVTDLDNNVSNILNISSFTIAPAGSSGTIHSTSGSGTHGNYACKDSQALNFSSTGIHKASLCKYDNNESSNEDNKEKETDNKTTTKSEKDESTSQDSKILKEHCPIFTEYYRRGEKGEQVPLIQAFLIKQGFNPGKVDGVIGSKTFAAIKAFQSKYLDEVLTPWGIDSPTGRWYQTTRKKANELMGCNVGIITLDNGKKI